MATSYFFIQKNMFGGGCGELRRVDYYKKESMGVL